MLLTRGWEMAPLPKCLQHKHEELSSDPGTHRGGARCVLCICNCNAGRVRVRMTARALWPASLANQQVPGSVRDLKKQCGGTGGWRAGSVD